MSSRAAPAATGGSRLRLAVGAMLLVAGVSGLVALDRFVAAGHRADVEAQALQAAAAIEGAMGGRVARLHALGAALGDAPTRAARADRFSVIAREIRASAPDVQFLYLIDTTGGVTAALTADSMAALREDLQLRIAGSSAAFHDARQQAVPRLTHTVPLRGGGAGLVAYEPIRRAGRTVGFVGAGFSYASLFGGAVARQLRGRAPFRVRDGAGADVIGASGFPHAPVQSSDLVSRALELPGGERWRLEFYVSPHEPVVARAAIWVAGFALLATLVAMAVNEDARLRNAARHTVRLEQLSRDLLDANLRLEERAGQVAEANRAKSRFLAHVSHELRTPLNAILGYNGLALEGVYGSLGPDLAEAHARIRSAANHLLGVVDAVLDLSKLELNRLGVEAVDVRVDALLAGVAAVVEPSAEAKGLRVDVIVEPDMPTLFTDPRHLHRALLALASNAIKFTDHGTVTLAARFDIGERGPRVSLAVDDTGPGIAPEEQQRIFEEFEQVRPAGRGDSIVRGAGLGLAVARKLVRLLGGDVSVTSVAGAGARFVIALPIRAATVG